MDISILRKGIEVWQPVEGMPEVEVLLRYLPQDEFDAIQKQATSYRLQNNVGAQHAAPLPQPERDEAAFRCTVARAVVKEWRGLTEDGAPWPCTPENIELLMAKWTEFRILVMSTPFSLARMIAARKEDVEKNSSTTSEPAPTSPA